MPRRAVDITIPDLSGTRGVVTGGSDGIGLRIAARLAAAREIVLATSLEREVPVENLIQPDLLRRLCWTPPSTVDVESVAQALRAGSAREWQVELFAAPLAEVLVTLG